MNLDATRIISGLYQGSAPSSAADVRRAGFSTLVFCAVEVQPPEHVCGGLTVIRCPLIDNGQVQLSEADWSSAWHAASRVKRRLRVGQRVLVTCAAGRNRSGLVTVLTLHQLTGRRGSACIQAVKRARGPMACTNPQFNSAVIERLG